MTPAPRPGAPLFTAGRTALPGGLLAVPSLGPPALVSGMTSGRGVFRRYVPCSSRLKGNPRKGAVNTGNLGPPHPVHAGVPAASSLPPSAALPAAAPRLSRPMPAPLHMRPSLPMPLASPAGRAGPPGSADAGPVPLASGPGASRVSAPRLPSYTGRLGAGSSAPPRSELRPPCGPFPRVSVSPSALPVPVHGRPAAGWTGNSPRHPAQSRRPGVFLPCGDAGVGNVRPVLSLRLMKRIPQSCFTFSF